MIGDKNKIKKKDLLIFSQLNMRVSIRCGKYKQSGSSQSQK